MKFLFMNRKEKLLQRYLRPGHPLILVILVVNADEDDVMFRFENPT